MFPRSLKASAGIRRCSLVAKSRNRFAGNAEEGLSPFVEFTGAKLRNMRSRRGSENLPASLFFHRQPAANEYKVAAAVWNFLKLPSSDELPARRSVFSERKMSAQATARCFIVFRRIALRPCCRSGRPFVAVNAFLDHSLIA